MKTTWRSDRFNEYIPLGFGWTDRVPCLFMDIINNIPMVDYNIDGQVHIPQTLATLLFDNDRIREGVDIAFSAINLTMRLPDEGEPKPIIIKDLFGFKEKVIKHGAGTYVFVSKKKGKRDQMKEDHMMKEAVRIVSILNRYCKMKAVKVKNESFKFLIEKSNGKTKI